MNLRNRLLLAAVLASLMIWGSGLLATYAQETPVAQGGYKIGVVNRITVFEKYQRQIDMMADLEADRVKREGELKGILDAFEKKVGDYNSKKESMTATDREQKELEFRQEQRDIEQRRNDWQSQLDDKTNQMIRSVQRDVYDAIQVIGGEDNYHLILESDRDPRAQSGVIFFSSTIDLTQRVVDYLNGKYKKP